MRISQRNKSPSGPTAVEKPGIKCPPVECNECTRQKEVARCTRPGDLFEVVTGMNVRSDRWGHFRFGFDLQEGQLAIVVSIEDGDGNVDIEHAVLLVGGRLAFEAVYDLVVTRWWRRVIP